MHIIDDCNKYNLVSFHFHGDSTMYWVRAHIIYDHTRVNIDMITMNYELLHHRLGHPFKDILRAAQKYIKNFPNITILSVELVCPSCQLGKQLNCSFSVNHICAKKPFELVHLDLNFFEIESYHRSRYIILSSSIMTVYLKDRLNPLRLRTRHLVPQRSL